jgi:hypothetical protein
MNIISLDTDDTKIDIGFAKRRRCKHWIQYCLNQTIFRLAIHYKDTNSFIVLDTLLNVAYFLELITQSMT